MYQICSVNTVATTWDESFDGWFKTSYIVLDSRAKQFMNFRFWIHSSFQLRVSHNAGFSKEPTCALCREEVYCVDAWPKESSAKLKPPNHTHSHIISLHGKGRVKIKTSDAISKRFGPHCEYTFWTWFSWAIINEHFLERKQGRTMLGSCRLTPLRLDGWAILTA